MTRHRVPAELVLVVGLMLTVVAGGLWALETTAHDATRIAKTADALLKTDPVRTAFAKKIAAALTAPTTDPTQVLPEEELASALVVGDNAVARPPFAQAFAGALDQVHAHVFDQATGPIVLDQELVGRAVAQATGGEPAPMTISVDGDLIPNLHQSDTRLRTTVPLLGLLGVLLVLIALVMSDHRARAVMRIGRWMLVSGLVGIVVFWLLPTVLFEPLGGWPAVLGIVTASGDWLLVPAAVLALGGALMIVAGHQWERVAGRRALAVIPHTPGRHVDTGTGWHSPV